MVSGIIYSSIVINEFAKYGNIIIKNTNAILNTNRLLLRKNVISCEFMKSFLCNFKGEFSIGSFNRTFDKNKDLVHILLQEVMEIIAIAEVHNMIIFEPDALNWIPLKKTSSVVSEAELLSAITGMGEVVWNFVGLAIIHETKIKDNAPIKLTCALIRGSIMHEDYIDIAKTTLTVINWNRITPDSEQVKELFQVIFLYASKETQDEITQIIKSVILI